MMRPPNLTKDSADARAGAIGAKAKQWNCNDDYTLWREEGTLCLDDEWSDGDLEYLTATARGCYRAAIFLLPEDVAVDVFRNWLRLQARDREACARRSAFKVIDGAKDLLL